MASFNCKEFISGEICQLPAINKQQHFSEVIKFLLDCENAWENITTKFGNDIRNERFFVETLMKFKLGLELFIDVDKKLRSKQFLEFEECLLDSYKDIIEEKTDDKQLFKLSDIIYNYQKVADELYLYLKYNPKSEFYGNDDDKESIRFKFVKKFFKIYEGVLNDNDIYYGDWKCSEFAGIRMYLLIKNL